MNKKKYLELRNGLYSEAEKLINEGKLEDGQAKMKEIENLDNKFEEEAKAIANLNAMNDNHRVKIINGISANVAGTVIDSFGDNASDEYTNAWAKEMMGIKLNVEESNVFTMKNEYTHTGENTGVVVPNTVMEKVWEEVAEKYPLYGDVFKTMVPGKVTLLKNTESSEAKWYDEPTVTEDGKDVFAEITLDGCELARSITISWKLKEMSIPDFVNFIAKQLSNKMGKALGYAVAQGKGKPGSTDSFKAEPTGIITALGKESQTPQIITYTDQPSYKDVTNAIAKVKGAYKDSMCIYANGTTIWGVIANITDSNGRPYFIASTVEGGVGTMFGKVVKEDDSIPDDAILIGNAYEGYHVNINREISINIQDNIKARTTDYVSYAIVDGGVRTTKAFALLKKGE